MCVCVRVCNEISLTILTNHGDGLDKSLFCSKSNVFLNASNDFLSITSYH